MGPLSQRQGGNNHNDTADADIGIDKVLENICGNMLVDVCSERSTDSDTSQSVKITYADRGCYKAIPRPHKCHQKIAEQKICLCHCDIMILIRLGSEKVQDCRRPLHTEKTSHKTAQSTGSDLHLHCWLQLDSIAHKREIQARQNQDCAQHIFQCSFFNPG